MAEEHVRRGSWTVRRRLVGRRYVDHRLDRTSADRRAVASPAEPTSAPGDAALVAIAGALGLSTDRQLPTDAVFGATEPARWLVEVVVEEVDRAINRGLFMRGGVSGLDGSPG